MPNGVISENRNYKFYTRKKNHLSVHSQQNHSSRNSEIEHGDSISEKNSKKQKVEPNSFENGNHLSKREILKLKKNEIRESIEMKSTEQRKEFLEREIEKRFMRTMPSGKDKLLQEVFSQLDALIGSLNPKGEGEGS